MTDVIEQPSDFAPLLEVRAILEFAACFAYMPALKCFSPKGDGHPVIALPPFMSDDKLTSPLRQFLASLDYNVSGWGLGRNVGFDEGILKKLLEMIEKTADENGAKTSIIGHSLGGIYARVVAHQIPHAVRQVIFLGTPFNITDEQSENLPVRKVYEKMNPTEVTSSLLSSGANRDPAPVPSTAIYSEGDGFVPWQACMDEEEEFTENLRVPGSHTGMPFNPAILYAIADRLAQPENDWQPFDNDGLRKWVYGTSSDQ